MRVLIAALLVALSAPASAVAAVPAFAVREVAVRGDRALSSAAVPRFDLVGLHWRGSGRVSFRTRSLQGQWGPWLPAAPEPEDLPDRASREARASRSWRIGNPYWAGGSDGIQYELHGEVRRLRAHFVRSEADSVPPRRMAVANAPLIVPRIGWQANESIKRGQPRYAAALRFSVVHHTAGANNYGPAQSGAIVRAIQLYHVRGNGWNDIGYNFLVDKYGQVFEGRYGGIARNVIGAHAGGFNTGSVGVALLGNYNSASLTAQARAALEQLLAWRLDLAHVDPLSSLTWLSAGNGRFPAGTPVTLRAVAGHRDTGYTDCPGSRLYSQLGSVARGAAAFGLPKLYDPAVRGRLGSPIRFTARLSAAMPWTVTVSDERGTVVASGAGTGTTVDWTWNALGITTGRFTWAIEAGPTVRPARGRVGTTAAELTLTGATASPKTITPNGDSRADVTTVSYVLSRPASVTATLRDAVGRPIAALFTGSRPAGRNAFRFTAAGVPDGVFVIELVARSGTREVRASVSVTVDRTLAAFDASPDAFSPNGDGRAERVHFSFVLTTRTEATLRIYRRRAVVARPFAGVLEAGTQTLTWDGRGSTGPVADGAYRAAISVEGALGTRVQNASFTVDTRPPVLRLLALRQLRFWVSEPVALTVRVNGGRPILQNARRGFVRVPFRTAVRKVVARAVDRASNSSLIIRAP